MGKEGERDCVDSWNEERIKEDASGSNNMDSQGVF